MWDAVTSLSIVVVFAVVLIGLLFFVRASISGKAPLDAMGEFFRSKGGRRLHILEQLNLDGRRRLILIRRDETEHLIITGGPVDIVVETGISAREGPQLASGPVDPTFSKDQRDVRL